MAHRPFGCALSTVFILFIVLIRAGFSEQGQASLPSKDILPPSCLFVKIQGGTNALRKQLTVKIGITGQEPRVFWALL